jgi:hypothetical protein
MESIREVLVCAALLVATATNAQDIDQLVGITPGEAMPEVEAARSRLRSAMPYVFFGVPTKLPALARIFPSAELTVLNSGIVVSTRWKRAYATRQECTAGENTLKSLLKPYVPADFAGNDQSRFQRQTKDEAIGLGISCRKNVADFHELTVELVHFKRDAELSDLIGSGRR